VLLCAGCLWELNRGGGEHLDGSPACTSEDDGQRRLAALSGQDGGVSGGRAA